MHVEESLLSIKLREGLKAMYRNIGGENQFKRPPEIRKAQLARALKLFLGKPDPPDDDPLWRDWSRGNPNCWSDAFNVHVDFGIDEDSVRELRAAKNSFCETMKNQAEEWRQNPKSLEEDIDANYMSLRTTLVRDKWLVLWLVQWVKALDDREGNPLRVVNEFFLSDEWMQTPFPYLWVRSWAKIAEMVRSPRGSRKPQSGDYYDAQILTHYAPYCDAMFIDGGYREIARDPRVGVQERFGTKCFSEQNRDQFLAYLDKLEQAMPDNHREALAVIHPPYRFKPEDLVDPWAWRHAEEGSKAKLRA